MVSGLDMKTWRQKVPDFTVCRKDPGSRARTGLLRTAHGTINTPAFMPVGTLGTVKSLTPEELAEAGVEILLCNAYHLFLRPGIGVISALGGLHRFIAWPHSILTDSGGFQTYSLRGLVRLSDDGACFTSPVDGTRHFLTPEKVIGIQQGLGSDIMMPLDDCPPFPSPRERVEQAVSLTTRWAHRSAAVHTGEDQALFGIVQGGTVREMRERSAGELSDLPFDGYALGGFSVGEPQEVRDEILGQTVSFLPEEKPKYLMGMGTPADILSSVAEGIDLFDCVLPTRAGRNGLLFTSRGKISVKKSCYAADPSPPDPLCSCRTCRRYSLAYLRHLFLTKEILAARLNTLHNVCYYMDVMRSIRRAIQDGTLRDLRHSLQQ